MDGNEWITKPRGGKEERKKGKIAKEEPRERGGEWEKRRKKRREKERKEGFACAHGNEKELLKSGACLATASRFSR